MKTFAKFKNEIRGLEDVKETVEAEEKISSSGIHFLFKKEKAFKGYLESVKSILARLLFFYEGGDFLLFEKNYSNKKVLVVFAGKKGFVGGLWQEMAKKISQTKAYEKTIIIGSKLKQELPQANKNFFWLDDFSDLPDQKEAKYIFEKMKSIAFAGKRSSLPKIDILLPKVITFSIIETQFEPLLPLKIDLQDESFKSNIGLPVFEGKKSEIFNFLAGQYFELKLLQLIWEAKLAEYLKRAMAMEKANEKVKKQIKDLRYNFFRQRRKILTKNQLEVFVGHKVAKI